ncbi:MAG: TetR family transcriptional regulator [Chloroflexi bacterium]|nr:MAG: TetR family transcriptional regulator [Chloroflexota bacterium]
MIGYNSRAVNSRPYVQRARARSVARTTTAIENAALREVARNGYAELRIAAVARRARVAPRTVYLHAPTKERLVQLALRRRADALASRVERWHPRAEAPDTCLAILRDLDRIRLHVISRTLGDLARRGVLRMRLADAVALAHALLAYPTWRTALTGPARRRAPRLVASALRSALL